MRYGGGRSIGLLSIVSIQSLSSCWITPRCIFNREKICDFLQQTLKTKFHEDSSNGSRAVEERTDIRPPFLLPFHTLREKYKHEIPRTWNMLLSLEQTFEHENDQKRIQRNPKFQISYIKVILCKAHVKFRAPPPPPPPRDWKKKCKKWELG
jgi:hypothetical protein